MLDLFINSKNSLSGLEAALRIAISNANNFNTPGFKYTYSSFTTVYAEAVSSGTETQNPIHFGNAMTLGATSTDFSQGNLSLGTQLDAAIVGEGFFIMSSSPNDFEADAAKVFTRAGRFQLDFNNKYIVDSFGRKVYGYELNAAGKPKSNKLVPLETQDSADVGIIAGGLLVSNFTEAKQDATTAKPMYQLALTTFQNKQGLVVTSGGAYSTTVASGDQLDISVSGGQLAPGSASRYGDVLGENLESANIDVAKVALDMNILNRSFQAVQGVIDDISKILSGLISKIGG